MAAVGLVTAYALLLAVAAFALFGGLPVGPIGLLVPLAAVGGGVALLRRGGGSISDVAWSGRRRGQPTAEQAQPSGPIPDVSVVAATKPPATPRQVAAALARAEAREWLASGWFAVGIGFCLLLTVLLGWVWAADSEESARDWFVLFPIMAHPMVGMAVVASHHAVTRARRSGAAELFEACPADEATRTMGHLRSSWVPAAVLAGFVVVSTVVHTVRAGGLHGTIDGRAGADALAAVVLGVCGAWLGVALGRWAPWRLVPVVVVAALLPVIVGLGSLGDPHWSNARQLSTWPRYPDHNLLFTDPPVWRHLVWLMGLGALMGVVALAHARRDRRVAIAGLAVVMVIAGAGLAQTRPISGEQAARLASLVAEPERHQQCRTVGRAEACSYGGYERVRDAAVDNVVPVLAAAPADVAAMTFRQVFDGDLETLGPEVGRALEGRGVGGGDDFPLGYSSEENAMIIVRLRAALKAVGLPSSSPSDSVPLVVAGEARGVVALWLAARGLEPDVAVRLASHHFDFNFEPDARPDAFELGMAWPDACNTGAPPVTWSPQDLSAARSLLALPETRVHDLLIEGWDRFTSSATTTDQLLAAAGLDPAGPYARIVARPVPCQP